MRPAPLNKSGALANGRVDSINSRYIHVADLFNRKTDMQL